MADDKPIIIIKKKGGHGGHHGGAWKVAYADFVTAMMAFFMVMWLVNSADITTKKTIASYFRRPGLFQTGSGTPLMIGESGILRDAYTPPRPDQKVIANTKSGSSVEGDHKPSKNTPKVSETDPNAKKAGKGEQDKSGAGGNDKQAASAVAGMIGAAEGDKLAEELMKRIATSQALKDLLGLIEVRKDADGLTIEIMDTERVSMFASGSARITPGAARAFQQITDILKKIPNQIDVMGHTDGKPFLSRGGLTNWELSSDRANAARRLMEQYGIPPDRIISVVGRADRDLKNPENPFDPSNRRISLKVKFKGSRRFDMTSASGDSLRGLEKILEDEPKENRANKPAEAGLSQVSAEKPTPVNTVAPKPTQGPAAGYMPKVERFAEEVKTTVDLPEDNRGVDNNNLNGAPSKLFKDNPIIGPIDPFIGH